MGLSNFSSPAQGVLPLLVMNTVMSVALVRNKLKSVLDQVVGGGDQDSDDEFCGVADSGGSRVRRVSIRRYGGICSGSGGGGGGGGDWPLECCVCLCRFEAHEEVSELSCKHFFHKGCLDKWFDNQHITCPLCRSIM